MKKIEVEILETDVLNLNQKERILELWNQQCPAQLQYIGLPALDEYLNGLKEPRHYLAKVANIVVAWAFVFERDMEIWFAIIVDGSQQHKGYGTSMLQSLKQDHSRLNGWVVDHNKYKKANGTQYSSPLDFYERNGFKTMPEVRLETEKLSAVKIKWESEK